jgi:hypothetical protein
MKIIKGLYWASKPSVEVTVADAAKDSLNYSDSEDTIRRLQDMLDKQASVIALLAQALHNGGCLYSPVIADMLSYEYRIEE